MTDRALENFLPTLSQAIALTTGLSFPEERWDDLCRALGKAAGDLGLQDTTSCARWLLEPLWSATRIENMAPYLTIGETHFFRDGKLFQALEERVLPELISKSQLNGRRLRFWSAGCATGEEPYSVAMLVNKIVPGTGGWDVTVLGSDINRNSLKKAREGVYTRWSFREVPQGIREAYFNEERERIEIMLNIKRMVNFFYLNLAKDMYPRFDNDTVAMDLIFCRNVLMYFTAERQERVVDNLCRCLVDGGWLIVSPAEATIVDNPNLVSADIPGAVLFRKVSRLAAKPRALQPLLLKSPLQASDNSNGEPTSCWWEHFEDSLTQEPPIVTPDDKSEVQPLNSDSESPGSEHGVELYNQGLYVEAAEKLALELERTQWQGPQRDSSISLLIRSCGNLGKLDEALQWAEKALATNILNAEHHYLQGMILQAKGNLDEAAISLNKAVFLHPDFVVAHFALGSLAFLRGDRKESDRHHKIALRVLRGWSDDELVPGSDGMTVGRLTEIIVAMNLKEKPHETP